MKFIELAKRVAWTITLILAHASALAQPVISSFSQNGELVCTNLPPGTVAIVEWASSVTGPWSNNWAGLDSVRVDSNGTIRVSVPMFYRVRGLAFDMALIPAGPFTMGDLFNEGNANELPTHSVYVSAFFIDRNAVIKAQWDDVRTWAVANGYDFDFDGSSKGSNHPVHTVNWFDAVKWCNARSEKEGRSPAYYTDAGLTQRYRSGQVRPYVNWSTGYRLPTEAEWEKAARGGANGRRFPWSDADTIAHNRANYYSSSSYAYDVSATRGYHPTYNDGTYPYTSPVGSFAANGYGVYDMAGNMAVWCWDWYGSYSSASQTDPRGPATPPDPEAGSFRVIRGTGWADNAYGCRVAIRSESYPTGSGTYLGFRSVLPAGQ